MSQLTKLTEKHYKITALAAAALPHVEIAKHVRVHYNTITRVLKRPEIQALVAELQQQTQAQVVERMAKSLAERMDEAADDAFERLTELVRGAKSETVQFKAVESILDRSTTAPKREIHSSRTVDVEQRVIKITLTADDLAQLRSGLVLEEPDDVIDAMPYRSPEKPLKDVLAELRAAAESEG